MTKAKLKHASEKELEQQIHVGIAKAYKDYSYLSGYDLDRAPEYYLTVKVADQLRSLNMYVDLECSVKRTLREANATLPGPIPKNIRGNGRFDFVAYYINEKPRFLGEVKHPISFLDKRLGPDLSRICNVLRRGDNNSFQRGFLIFYAFKRNIAGSREKLKTLLDSLHEECERGSTKLSCNVKMNSKSLLQDDDHASASVCMIVSK